MRHFLALLTCLTAPFLFSQTYTSYRTGNSASITSIANGGICLMGGASEQDDAMIWFLQRASGGDILVLRTSGSDGYNNYLYTDLGVSVNSVETIVCHSAAASDEIYVQDRIKEAEAIWFAGGDQWDYISFWRDTPIDSLINEAITERNIAIGGTSAGMAIQGGYYFSAENGTITSAAALNDPFNSNLTISNLQFIQNNFLQHVITDTHYDNPDRKGRHVTFMARMINDDQVPAKGIACDEYTAVCIAPDGIAHVYGDPAYEDIAYFLQANCEINNNTPEIINSGTPLTWDHTSTAIKAYVIHGTLDGSRTFDLNDWQTGNGGNWENWSVANGTLTTTTSIEPDCSLIINSLDNTPYFYPNPATNVIKFTAEEGKKRLINAQGKMISETDGHSMMISTVPNGWYILEWSTENRTARFPLQINH